MLTAEHVIWVEIIQDVHNTPAIPVICHSPAIIDVSSGILQNLEQSTAIEAQLVQSQEANLHVQGRGPWRNCPVNSLV